MEACLQLRTCRKYFAESGPLCCASCTETLRQEGSWPGNLPQNQLFKCFVHKWYGMDHLPLIQQKQLVLVKHNVWHCQSRCLGSPFASHLSQHGLQQNSGSGVSAVLSFISLPHTQTFLGEINSIPPNNSERPWGDIDLQQSWRGEYLWHRDALL